MIRIYEEVGVDPVLKIEAGGSFEMLVTTYQTIRNHDREDRNLHGHKYYDNYVMFISVNSDKRPIRIRL